MDTVAPEASNGQRENDPKPIEPGSKGTMREPTQQAGAGGDLEELKKALQKLEEQKGDWSKGG